MDSAKLTRSYLIQPLFVVPQQDARKVAPELLFAHLSRLISNSTHCRRFLLINNGSYEKGKPEGTREPSKPRNKLGYTTIRPGLYPKPRGPRITVRTVARTVARTAARTAARTVTRTTVRTVARTVDSHWRVKNNTLHLDRACRAILDS